MQPTAQAVGVKVGRTPSSEGAKENATTQTPSGRHSLAI